MKLPHLGLFGRLFLLFSITTVLLALFIALGSFTMPETEAKSIISDRHDNIVEMLGYTISASDDREKIGEEARSKRVHLLIKKNGGRWSTSKSFPEIETLLQIAEPIGSLKFAKYKSKYYLLFNEEDDWIVATALAANIIVYRDWLVYWPWLAALLTLLISYLMLRKLFGPVSQAIKSTQMISQGKFDYRIPHHPKTELAQLTRGLNKMASDLKQLFEAKDELLLAISHELRTPMARMTVSLAMLEKNQVVDDLNNDIEQMNNLIEQLLEGERLQQGHKVLSLIPYFLPSLVEDIVTEQGIADRVKLVGEVPEIAVNIDVGRIKFLVRNLLKNAIAHSKSTDTVQLKIAVDSRGVVMDVIDKGTGIPEASLDKIFEPFYCVENINNRSTEGTGLGLYLCQRIAQAHNGQLRVKNNEDKGCQFSFMLPNDVIAS